MRFGNPSLIAIGDTARLVSAHHRSSMTMGLVRSCRLCVLRRRWRWRSGSRDINRCPCCAGRGLARNWRRDSPWRSRAGEGRRRWFSSVSHGRTAMRELLLVSCFTACGLQGVLVRSRGRYICVIVSLILGSLFLLIHRPWRRWRPCGKSNTLGSRFTALARRGRWGWSRVRRRRSWGRARDWRRRPTISLAGDWRSRARRRRWPSILRPGDRRRYGRETRRRR